MVPNFVLITGQGKPIWSGKPWPIWFWLREINSFCVCAWLATSLRRGITLSSNNIHYSEIFANPAKRVRKRLVDKRIKAKRPRTVTSGGLKLPPRWAKIDKFNPRDSKLLAYEIFSCNPWKLNNCPSWQSVSPDSAQTKWAVQNLPALGKLSN